mmetsp:Transcript_24523/g.32859  ORF Transcript_24523/g.32859 Transcript_24523/m.32859 type:complete len:85 (-) Transcript_24523:728-982(-)|eukprot:CAMPEP_0185620092 /NCGR_PEP_ID=MMETSP0436-20130131/52910_1 /TAXON_ID=626734 ORGANISM="Favella taraikaensis, Strain Fe Narragansett Bay" /NCGR_SAMPLE_ID=MMETSP0436 /ASSEMBLY_ACC=CAM_ASM_000390 /LENGTH=84 /DNA_ID=CAMNT_0028260159 /DNA_START=753 /DNA_END=1007 /DNA_ORIENTATION=+
MHLTVTNNANLKSSASQKAGNTTQNKQNTYKARPPSLVPKRQFSAASDLSAAPPIGPAEVIQGSAIPITAFEEKSNAVRAKALA